MNSATSVTTRRAPISAAVAPGPRSFGSFDDVRLGVTPTLYSRRRSASPRERSRAAGDASRLGLALPDVANAASIRVLEKLGFSLTRRSTVGGLDTVFYERRR